MIRESNLEIRKKIEEAGIHFWQIADRIGISDSTICKWFRKELSPDRKDLILKAIDELTKEQQAKA